MRAQIRRVDVNAIVEAFLGEHDGASIRLFAARAAGVPDANLRIGAQDRHDLGAERQVAGRIAKHVADTHHQALEHVREEGRVRDDTPLELGEISGAASG